MRLIMIALATCTLAIAGAPSTAAGQQMPRDQNASAKLQKEADYLESMAHFGASAVKCRLWSAAEEEQFHTRFYAAALDLDDRRDSSYATTLLLEGEDRAVRQFGASPAAECLMLRKQDVLGRLRELASGRRSFWVWP
jgi:hypothetical protein